MVHQGHRLLGRLARTGAVLCRWSCPGGEDEDEAEPPERVKPYPRYIVRIDPQYRTYCILGDGELNKGQNWEAAMFAGKYKLDNLVAIVDYNKWCVSGPTNDIMPMEPMVDKWKAFGWWVTEIDGHDFRQICDALDLAVIMYGDNKPKVIIAHTVKGRGIPSLGGKAHTPRAWQGDRTGSKKEGRNMAMFSKHVALGEPAAVSRPASPRR